MTNRQLAQVGLGLIGVWALVDALRSFSFLGMAFFGEGGPQGRAIIAVGVPLFLLLGLSYVLVFRSSSLAAAIASEGEATGGHSIVDLSRTLVVLLGVMLLAQSVPLLVNIVLAFLAAGEFPGAVQNSGLLRNFVGSGIQLTIALFLIIRPGRVLSYIRLPQDESAS